MSFNKNGLVDRRIYDKKGSFQKPNSQYKENIFYFISKPLTIESTYNSNGQEVLKPTIEITIFGGKPIVPKDLITLQEGTTMRVKSIGAINYYENNLLVRDKMVQRIESMVLKLE